MKSTKGFTLIELMVVVAIIGILAAGSVALYTGSQEKSRDAVRVSDVQTLNSALSQYNVDNTDYPDTATDATELTGMSGTYIQSLPNDPQGVTIAAGTLQNVDQEYFYAVGTSNNVGPQSFEISTVLESGINDGKESGDGGNGTGRFEVGTAVGTIDTSSDAAVIIAVKGTASAKDAIDAA